jgi:hypothetical protein
MQKSFHIDCVQQANLPSLATCPDWYVFILIREMPSENENAYAHPKHM